MIRILLSLTVALGLLASLPAAAQSTRAAALAQVRAEFAASDIDHDGTVTKAEMVARLAGMKPAGAARPLTAAQARQLTDLWFQRIDANHDGRVTLGEAEAEAGQLFDRYDTNHDGVISPAERAAAHAQLAPKPPARR